MNKLILVALAGLLIASVFVFTNAMKPAHAQEFIFRPAMNLTENDNGIFPQVAAYENNVYVLWSRASGSLFRASADNGASFSDVIKLEIAGQKIAASGSNVYVVGLHHGKISLISSNDTVGSFGSPIHLGGGSSPDMDGFGTNVYVVWQQAHQSIGSKDWESEVLFRASNDNGITFDEEIDLSNNAGKSVGPKLAASGSRVYVIWEDDTNLDGDTDQIFFRASNDEGATFADVINLSNDSTRSSEPLIVASGSNVYVVWEHYGSGERDLFFRASSDGGATFGDTINLSENLGDGYRKQIAALGDDVYVAWNSGGRSLFFWASHDNGRTFDDTVKLSGEVGTQGLQLQWQPKIVLSGKNVYTLFTDELDVFFRMSNDYGRTFDDIIGLTDEGGSGAKGGIDLAVSGNNVYAVWNDLTKQGWKILFRTSEPYAFIGTISERGCSVIGGNIVTDWMDSQRTQQVVLCKYNDEYFRIIHPKVCPTAIAKAKDPMTGRILELGYCDVPSTWIRCSEGHALLGSSEEGIIMTLVADCDKNFMISVTGSVDEPNMQFDKEMKRLIVLLRTKQQTPVNITLPRELLDGPYSIKMTQQYHVGKIKGEWTVNQNSTHASFFRELKQDITTIEITGTTAIPEFPVNSMVIAAVGLIGAFIALRAKSNGKVELT